MAHKMTVESHPPETSFVIHLWIEPGSFWRGRVSDGEEERHFEDGQTLLEFIEDRLITKFGVPFRVQP
jgi:hypothetical protein